MDESLQQRLGLDLQRKKDNLADKLALLPESKDAYMQTVIDERMRWAYEIMHDFIKKQANGEREAEFEQATDVDGVVACIKITVTDNAPYYTQIADIHVSVKQKDISLGLATRDLKVGIVRFSPRLDNHGNPSRFSGHIPKAIMFEDDGSYSYPISLDDSTTKNVIELIDSASCNIIETQLARLAKLGKSVGAIT